MQAFTVERNSQTADELWVTEHPPVYTLGLNRKDVRMPSRDDIPVVNTDRGGKITYHGPGQLVIYCLIDLKRKGLNVRQLVSALENSIVQLLAEFNISAEARADAPGVYVADKKNGKAKKIAEDILEAKKLREQAQKLLEEAQIFHKHSVLASVRAWFQDKFS